MRVTSSPTIIARTRIGGAVDHPPPWNTLTTSSLREIGTLFATNQLPA
jgi:hypothetical protein